MSDAVQENTVVTPVIEAVTSVVEVAPVMRAKGRKARGGTGDKPVKEKKAKPAKVIPVSKTWNVPRPRGIGSDQTIFLKHIHSLIVELAPELLEMEDIRNEFNSLVEFLSTYTNADFVTWTPNRASRYAIYTYMGSAYNPKYSFLCQYGRWQNWRTEQSPEKLAIEARWLKFWELIKPAMWAPLKRVHFDKDYRVRIKQFQDTIINIENATEQRIVDLRERAERQKKYFIEQITKMLKEDPDYKEEGV
jgi:hypothetical protein